MKARAQLALCALMIVGAALPTTLEAQTKLYAGVGGSFPTGEFGEYADIGWLVAGGVLFPISRSRSGAVDRCERTQVRSCVAYADGSRAPRRRGETPYPANLLNTSDRVSCDKSRNSPASK
jgi:hypothetical protein